MIKNQSVLALITARGGSKGLPGKNIRHLHGKPLINWTIEAAQASPSIDTIVLSTDDNIIAGIAKSCGVRVPFFRPDYLANDKASSIDVVFHALKMLDQIGEKYEILVLLEPTSPLRETSDIEKSLSILTESSTGSVVSVCRSENQHPDFLYYLDSNSKIVPFTNKFSTSIRRQDLNSVYFPEGTIYASYIETLYQKKSFFHANTHAYEIPKWKSIEIDDIYDFVMAEAIMTYEKYF